MKKVGLLALAFLFWAPQQYDGSGALRVEKQTRWSQTSTPAVGNQATASRAAGGGTVKHVADCVTLSSGATTAPGAATQLTVNLRDGATGAGTVLWTYMIVVPAATGQLTQPHTICGLNIQGSANTAMTFEWSAALTNLFETASISGYDLLQ